MGPAFAWANLHLVAKRGGDPFAVPTRVHLTHPADDARMKVMLYGLKAAGFDQELPDIECRWGNLIATRASRVNRSTTAVILTRSFAL